MREDQIQVYDSQSSHSRRSLTSVNSPRPGQSLIRTQNVALSFPESDCSPFPVVRVSEAWLDSIRLHSNPRERVASNNFMAENSNTDENSRRFIGRVVGAAVLLIGAILGIGLFSSSRPQKVDDRTAQNVPAERRLERPPPVSQKFAGSAVCRECHAQIWELYQSHPMARTLSEVGSAEQTEDDTRQPAFSRGNREYRVERADGKIVHHEMQRDPGGNVIYDQGVEIRYAIGSGTHGRSYLIDRD